MEEQRKNSYDPNEDIVDRMWKRSKNSINLVIVVCNILGIPCSHTDRRDRELQTYDGLRCGVCAAD